MINLRVNKVWKGKVAIRQKYVTEAINTRESIRIYVDKEYMDIPLGQLAGGIKSTFPVVDKFSDHTHYLVYYPWRPVKQ